jgi:hypothetical protein
MNNDSNHKKIPIDMNPFHRRIIEREENNTECRIESSPGTQSVAVGEQG